MCIIFAQKYYNSTTLSVWVVYTYTCVSKNTIMSKDTIFYLFLPIFLTSYAEPIIYKKNLLFSHSIVCNFQWITQGRQHSKISKAWHRWNEMEWNQKFNYAADTFCVANLLFSSIFLCAEGKWLLERKLGN